MTRRTKGIGNWDALGGGKCEGWRAIREKRMPDGMICEVHCNAIAGFEGIKRQVATREDLAAMGRARRIRASAFGLHPPTTLTIQ
jgi:hypothetical protein